MQISIGTLIGICALVQLSEGAVIDAPTRGERDTVDGPWDNVSSRQL